MRSERSLGLFRPWLRRAPHPPQKLETVYVRHADIANENVRPFSFNDRECFIGVAGSKHLRIAISRHPLD